MLCGASRYDVICVITLDHTARLYALIDVDRQATTPAPGTSATEACTSKVTRAGASGAPPSAAAGTGVPFAAAQ